MKTLLMVVAVALLPLNLALATPLTEAGPAGIHPAQLSLPGEVIEDVLAPLTGLEDEKPDSAPQR